mmetsp:Transcript_28924/g.88716  ORF Transcript_28924/g.88716 Transcript_28924/m.88716 type:complete len:225 (-) Transcript_28924:1704-2378(-)
MPPRLVWGVRRWTSLWPLPTPRVNGRCSHLSLTGPMTNPGRGCSHPSDQSSLVGRRGESTARVPSGASTFWAAMGMSTGVARVTHQWMWVRPWSMSWYVPRMMGRALHIRLTASSAARCVISALIHKKHSWLTRRPRRDPTTRAERLCAWRHNAPSSRSTHSRLIVGSGSLQKWPVGTELQEPDRTVDRQRQEMPWTAWYSSPVPPPQCSRSAPRRQPRSSAPG